MQKQRFSTDMGELNRVSSDFTLKHNTGKLQMKKVNL